VTKVLITHHRSEALTSDTVNARRLIDPIAPVFSII
jgi:hypothetical protein